MSEKVGEFEQLLLFAILRLRDDAYGVAIRQEIESRTGRSVAIGAIYTSLGRLEERRLVESSLGDTTPARGGRRRKYYRLLPAGARALQNSYVALGRMAEGMTDELAHIASSTSPGRG